MCSGPVGSCSKDFQLAAWLCEVWTHLHRMEGFVAGTHLLAALVERYWDQAWPRIASFVWMNDALSLLLSLHVPLMAIAGREPSTVNLGDWQRVEQLAEDEAGRGAAGARCGRSRAR